MHSIAARIALLAYLIGGIVVPAVHRHEASVWRGEAASVHAHAGCVQQGHAHEHAASTEIEAEEQAQSTVADASSDHTSACSDSCVVCVFAGSPQSGLQQGAITLSERSRPHLKPEHEGPGFDAFDGEPNRLRGPPVSMIWG